jgi:hypothetical protein
MLETFETFYLEFSFYRLANALAVATIASINADSLTFVAEERNTDLSTSLESSWFEGVSSSIALETWLGVRDYELNLGWQLSVKNSVGRSIRYYVADKALFEEVNTCDEVVTDRHLLKSLLVHEDIILTLFVEVLVWTALNAYILKFLTNVEAALQNATIYYIFELNTHNGVTLSWLNVQEVDYEIQTAIHADANTVLNVL